MLRAAEAGAGAGPQGAGNGFQDYRTVDRRAVADVPQTGIPFDVVRIASEGVQAGSQEAACEDHEESLCRWSWAGLVVGIRSSAGDGGPGGMRCDLAMAEADNRHSSHAAAEVGRDSRSAGGGRWVGIRDSGAVAEAGA